MQFYEISLTTVHHDEYMTRLGIYYNMNRLQFHWRAEV